MNGHVVRFLVVGTVVAAFMSPALFAQSVEINPYVGRIWPDSSHIGELKNDFMWGIRAGVHLEPSFALEANFGYLNHFELRGTDPKVRGLLWEVGPTYSFSSEDWPLPKAFTPHLSFSAGGITTHLKDPNTFAYNVYGTTQVVGSAPQTTVRQVQVQNGDTFFTLSAGGGLKINPGPIGIRADIRARMLPNFYRSSPIWTEATVGVSFVLGKR